VLFIFPLAVTAGRVRRLTWLGSDLCDYNAPLLAENFADFVPAKRFASLWHDIRRLLGEADIFRHDAVELTKMPERGGEQPNPFLSLNVALHPSGAHIVHLTGNWNDFYKSRRSSTTRQRDRTKYNRLRDLGEVRFVTAHNSFDIGEVVETLFEQKTKSFARMGIANIFEEDGCREFFFDFATSPDSRHLTHVSSLQVGGICAATNLALCFSGRYYHVLASHDDGLISRFGPGAAHLRHLLRHAFEHGYRQFDFTIGDEAYKLEWADTNLKLYDHIAPATLRGWPLAAGAAMRGRVKRVIKQTPMLWQSFRKMRARLAGWTKHRESTGRARGGRLQDSPSIMPD
jgi:CelD/BcsL family acetyltransferase involved in cellulose biosynthesis